MNPAALIAKQKSLASWLRDRGSVAVGFSGGIDSAYLAVTAVDVLGSESVLAVIGVSASLASEIRERAALLVREFHVPFREIDTHELDDPDYVANRGDRCFHCKQELWERIIPVARAADMKTVVDGTIVDDLSDHRPGLAAGERAGVKSPLVLAGFTKADVRAAALVRGIGFWDAPSAPCLSSRVMTGIEVNRERLAAIERAESGLRNLGIAGDLRVRHLGGSARVELPVAALAAWESKKSRGAIATVVQDAGFARVELDERGYRRGSMRDRGTTEVTDITVSVAEGVRDTST